MYNTPEWLMIATECVYVCLLCSKYYRSGNVEAWEWCAQSKADCIEKSPMDGQSTMETRFFTSFFTPLSHLLELSYKLGTRSFPSKWLCKVFLVRLRLLLNSNLYIFRTAFVISKLFTILLRFWSIWEHIWHSGGKMAISCCKIKE